MMSEFHVYRDTSYIGYKPSYWHKLGTEPLSYLTVGQLVEIAAKRWGVREALVSVFQGHRITFSEAHNKADRLAAGLLQLGLNPGDRLGIWGTNSSQWYISRLAAARGGFIAVQIDPAYQTLELPHSLNKVGVKILICSEFYKTNSCYKILQTVVPELVSCPESGVCLESAKVPSLKSVIIMSSQQYRGAHRFDDVISSASPESLKKIAALQTLIQPDDGCTIQYSSGTTGFPKATLATHHNLVNSAIISGKYLELNAEATRHVICPQFCHVTGSLGGIICGLCYGSTVVLPAPTFDPIKTLAAIKEERCTNIIGSPSLYVDLIGNAKKLDIILTTLRVGSVGGSLCTKEIVQGMLDTLNIKRVCALYGMTEISVVFMGKPGDSVDKMTSTVGSICDHMEAKVVDENGRVVPVGSGGELWVRGYSVMQGYWGDKEKTSELIGPDGWTKTGDNFVLDEDGCGRFLGRFKDMIVKVADNIFPIELEEFFLKHPDVLEAVVFGVPDTKVGEDICLYLRLRSGINLTDEDIISYCKDKISEYRIPRHIRFVTEFPKTSMGKIMKSVLRDALVREIQQVPGIEGVSRAATTRPAS
ncbi:acyl-CoA synthetase family member 2, mitochondrial-like isoform X1 [Zootermopsis nevadensis]|uniref:acyl-CoA synthetase family member 2, mitochondrial-like isoform X1 n=1 Tax=Zootermopsis nevadensis TaxID=136037 RepID=UPI000B8E3E77|nr:acyl-CoA synthetase family member 2, mitochondrial-like isoform X1 [Zootermopsis nevadensis]XP_021929479.1 acyl-CoA synthetase family member 2, mitochondrial-like isoform X1 [Zootermopsis nevadensis]